jgi:hypothetical protein
MLTFPTAFFAPQGLQPRPVGASTNSGGSLSGLTQFAATAGGFHWEVDLTGVALWTREKTLVWRAIELASDGGATGFVVPLCDRIHQPFANPKRLTTGFRDDAVFSDGALWVADQITAATVGAGALRATSLTISFVGPAPLIGGEKFTVWHPTKGQRLYGVKSLVDNGDGTLTIQFRPPLREAMLAGDTLDFDNPRCVMRVDGDMSAALELLKRGTGAVKFVETF